MKEIIVISDSEVVVDGKMFIPKEEPKQPKFKVGDWIIGKNSDFFPLTPCRIIKLIGDGWVIYRDEENGKENKEHTAFRLATPKEIEAHLRKICDEKYLGKKVRCLRCDDDIYVIRSFDRFDYIDGKLSQVVYNANERCMVLYDALDNKWAEIIPDKKKLPKTKDELISLIWDYNNNGKLQGISQFLEQYED